MTPVSTILTKQQKTVRSAAYVLMFMVLASRILGLLRDRLLASRFDPETLGVYFAAFRVPNFLFEILVMGALTSAFIPVFTRFLHADRKEEAWKMSSALITICSLILLVISIPMIIWTEQISRFLTPGFSEQQIVQMSQFTRFIVLAQVLPLLIGNFFTGILQSYNVFLIPAAAPVVYNGGIILGIFLWSSTFGLWAPVYGVGLGAVLFMVIQIPSLIRFGFRYQPFASVKSAGVKDVLSLMAPRTIGLAVSQIDTTVDLILSSLLGAKMVTVFQFAQHLQQLPIGLFGATVAQAAFPLLSSSAAKNDNHSFKETIVSALNQICFYILPITVLFLVLRIPIVRLVFGAAQYDWEATVLTGMTLSFFALSLAAQAAIQVLTRAFYAQYDTKTPVAISMGTIAINTILSLVFIRHLHLPVWSLGLSTSIASIIHMVALSIFLRKKISDFSLLELLDSPLKMAVASLLMGIALWVPVKLFDQLVFDTTRTFGLLLLTGVSSVIGLAVYLYFVWIFDVSEARTFILHLQKVRRPKTLFIEPVSEVVANGTQDSPIV